MARPKGWPHRVVVWLRIPDRPAHQQAQRSIGCYRGDNSNEYLRNTASADLHHGVQARLCRHGVRLNKDVPFGL